MNSRKEIADMTEKMTQWIVDHMTQSELVQLAFDVVSGNMGELPDEEIRATYAHMFESSNDTKGEKHA